MKGLLDTIAQLWIVPAAARDVERTLAGLVSDTRARLGDVPMRAWSDPYAIGFLVTLITLEARRARRLGPQGLGLVQVSVWQRLTGISDPSIGERICVLAAGSDPAFMQGCIDARAVHDRLAPGGLLAPPAPGPPSDAVAPADFLWSRTIESHLESAMCA